MYWDNGTGSGLAILANSIGVVNQFTTTGTVSAAALVDGQRYRFSVVSVNSIGDSVTATPLGIYAATVPDPPNAPVMIS